MSGHSKWSKIKRAKESKDKQKGNIFSKISRLITLAVTENGGITDPENNIRLRMVIEKAKTLNMPKDSIEKAIERGVGPNKATLKEIIYEGFGPMGVGIIVVTTTDNPNRTATAMRQTFEMNGGKLGNVGSVSHMFTRCGVVVINKIDHTEAEIFNTAQEIGADDIIDEEEQYILYIPFEKIGHVTGAEVEYKPNMTIEVTDQAIIEKISTLINALESLDDVHEVFVNCDYVNH